MTLALLDVGPTEFLLIAGLFLLLFGADKIPDLARSVGKATAQFRGAAKEFQDQLDRERGLAFRPGDAVPPAQKRQLAEAEDQQLAQLRAAARALGIDPQGKGEAELRAAIAGRVGR
ncbi:MAG TPA: twin-arginine translocase TatA/TatE family subunit [Candidatus Thermoplasmatota archaeon]|nr:twin-arginine translocase TatA/TatE family subunit [Candidatus Thermoplasmatota archaeon]